MTRSQLAYVRSLGFVEGVSPVFLLFVAMPVRALTHDESIVREVGAIHGILFLMYVYTLISTAIGRLKGSVIFYGCVASCLPFGSFWFDRKYLKPIRTIRPSSRTETSD